MKGFSFAEFMIMAAILGILGAIAIPNFLAWQERRRTLPAEDPRTPEQKTKDEFNMELVGEVDGCHLYKFYGAAEYQFITTCPRTCPETKKP